MDPENERVREALKAPIPDPWKPCQTKDGQVYFFNFATEESIAKCCIKS